MQNVFFIESGETIDGWVEYTLTHGAEKWVANVSCLGNHPVREFVHAVLEVFDALNDCISDYTTNCHLVDEPGGMIVSMTPISWQKISISVIRFDDCFVKLDTEHIVGKKLVGEFAVDFWTFAEAVLRDTLVTINRQGITGVRQEWMPNLWGIDGRGQVLPVEHILYLIKLCKDRELSESIKLSSEIELLQEAVKILQ